MRTRKMLAREREKHGLSEDEVLARLATDSLPRGLTRAVLVLKHTPWWRISQRQVAKQALLIEYDAWLATLSHTRRVR